MNASERWVADLKLDYQGDDSDALINRLVGWRARADGPILMLFILEEISKLRELIEGLKIKPTSRSNSRVDGMKSQGGEKSVTS